MPSCEAVPNESEVVDDRQITFCLNSPDENMASIVESSLKPSRFSWTPKQTIKIEPSSAEETVEEHVYRAPDNGNPCGCPSILIVDDQEFNRFALLSMLENIGLKCETACDGLEAIDKLSAAREGGCECGRFEIVFMDYNMPNLDGVATMHRIKEKINNDELDPVTVIGLTGYTEDVEMQEMLQSGMVDVLTKPVGKQGIFTTLSRWVSLATSTLILDEVSEEKSSRGDDDDDEEEGDESEEGGDNQ
eukprot:CAMPEP_0115017730 /NCGR_PEP_ID=MMETSP0216-20121206/28315_1 /TAXON_ID=223996 /ORGANISM="Protocruzia adherens, Strain Boccale" /LENGTH=246 /DNA_ID=CAMNT_0002388651 /DNA_START=121 /DNA_END=861 /DNA_ORIENTATION=-